MHACKHTQACKYAFDIAYIIIIVLLLAIVIFIWVLIFIVIVIAQGGVCPPTLALWTDGVVLRDKTDGGVPRILP